MNQNRKTPQRFRRSCSIPPGRNGFLLVELVVALMLVAAVASVLPVALNAVYQQRSQERFERLAQLELSNVVTRLEVKRPADDSDNVRLSDWFQEMYPDAFLEIVPGSSSMDSPVIALTVSILRPRGRSQPPLKQELTSWLEPRQEESSR